MSAIQGAPSGERSQGRGRYGVVCRGNPVWSIAYMSALSWSLTKGTLPYLTHRDIERLTVDNECFQLTQSAHDISSPVSTNWHQCRPCHNVSTWRHLATVSIHDDKWRQQWLRQHIVMNPAYLSTVNIQGSKPKLLYYFHLLIYVSALLGSLLGSVVTHWSRSM